MIPIHILLFAISILCRHFAHSAIKSDEQFGEQLSISALPNGDVLSLFQFSISSKADEIDEHNNSKAPLLYVPWLFRQLVEQHGVVELRLSMAQGFWRAPLWGAAPLGAEVPSGTELAIQFDDAKIVPSSKSPEQKWTDIVQAVNGLFCSSLLQFAPQMTSRPQMAISDNGGSNGTWLFGTLSAESVCTENLKAWKKLLPCKKRGLVSLLDPVAVLSERFHALSLRIRRTGTEWHIVLRAQTVHGGQKIARQNGQQDLLEALFNRRLLEQCPVARESVLRVERIELMPISPEISANMGAQVFQNCTLAVFDLNKWLPEEQQFLLDFQLEPVHDFRSLQQMKTINVHSHLATTDQLGGHITSQLHNPFDWALRAQFVQQVPWQLHTFLHTLAFQCRSRNKQNDGDSTTDLSGTVIERAFTLARRGQRPLLIELVLELPAESICTLQVYYEAAFLKISDFPPDANSGIFVPGALLAFPLAQNKRLGELFDNWSASCSPDCVLRVFGEPLLVLLPVPDFSMPFNVICLVCTAIAIFYGNAIALTTKIMKPVLKREQPSAGAGESAERDGNLLVRTVRAVRSKCGALFARLRRGRKETMDKQE